MLINRRNAMMAGKRLPYDAEAEYLESTGTQWIDTGVPFGEMDVRARVNFMYWSTPGGGTKMILASGVGSNRGFVISTALSDGAQVWNLGIGANNFAGSVVGNTWYDVQASIRSTGSTLTINGTTVVSSSAYSNFNGVSLFIFARNNNGTADLLDVSAPARVASLDISVSGTLVRSFIPVRVGNVGYMYDRVSGRLFGNEGTGDFVLGPDVVPVEYIESHGTEWIDTGVKLKTPCVVDADFIPIADNLADRMLLGVTSGGNTRICPIAILNGYFVAKTPDGRNTNITACQSGSEYSVSTSFGSSFVYRINNTTKTVDGGSITSSYGLLVFANNWNGTVRLPNVYGLTGRIKRLYIENGDGVTNNFQPVRVGSGSTWEGAMMDVLTRRIYRNAGTGAFAYGNDLKYPIPAE